VTVVDAKMRFLENLRARGYSPKEILRQEMLLRKTFQYGLALHHSDIPHRLGRVRADEFGAQGPMRPAALEAFLDTARDALKSVRYLDLGTLFKEYPDLLPAGGRAAVSFLESLGATAELRTLTRGLVAQILDSGIRSTTGESRSPAIIQAFLEFCFERGLLAWNPQAEQRMPSERVFEPDFFGPPGARWADHARAYLVFLKEDRNLALGGIDYYSRKLKPFVQWLDAAAKRQPTRSTLVAFLERKSGEGVSPNTLSKYLYCIRLFFDFLIRTRRIRTQENPAAALHIRSGPSAQRRILDEPQLKRLIDSLESAVYASAHPQDAATAVVHFRAVRDLAMIVLFALCGLRLSEMAGTTVEDVLFDKRVIRIHGKGNRSARSKIREIVVDGYAWKCLREYLKRRDHHGQQYLWISWSGRPLRPASINKLVHARLGQAGLDVTVSPHGLRATCASLYVKKGMDPYALKTLLGHESLKTTMDAYARLTEEELREVWKRTNPLSGYDDE